ncbi:hypothetical protein ACFLVZ_03250 [Chloroflexota bacterium]
MHGIKAMGAGRFEKFEQYMGHFEYSADRIFENPTKIDYQDAYIGVKGKLLKINLLDINDGEEIKDRIVQPSLALYRK